MISCDLSYRFIKGSKTKKFHCLQTLVLRCAGRCLSKSVDMPIFKDYA